MPQSGGKLVGSAAAPLLGTVPASVLQSTVLSPKGGGRRDRALCGWVGIVGCTSPQPLSLLLLYAKLRPQAAMPYRPPIRPYSARAIVRLVQDSLTNLLDT